MIPARSNFLYQGRPLSSKSAIRSYTMLDLHIYFIYDIMDTSRVVNGPCDPRVSRRGGLLMPKCKYGII